MLEIRNAICDTVVLIDEVTDMFYKQNDQNGYKELNNLIKQISTIMEHILVATQGGVQDVALEMIKYLDSSLAAMEEKDTILLSDILRYEIKDRFQMLLNLL